MKLVLLTFLAVAALAQKKDHTFGYDDTPMIPNQKWHVHDINRPHPPLITPAVNGKAPSDAIVLFDGKDLSKWVTRVKGEDTEPKWKIENGYFEVVPKTGSIVTKEKFGDVQLHLEWSEAAINEGVSQLRGNSGVIFQTRYEIQVLESHDNKTYADGQAGAIYGQHPPLVNASLPPDQWQSYDILYEAPRFDADKKLVKPAYFTVIHNGVVVQNHAEVLGTTPHAKNGVYIAHGDDSLLLQNHGSKVRFRNIWIRRLSPTDDR